METKTPTGLPTELDPAMEMEAKRQGIVSSVWPVRTTRWRTLIEVALSDQVDRSIEEAHVLGRDLLELFGDRIALVGYCPVQVHVIGTSPMSVNVGEAFPLAIPTGFSEISIERITPDDLRPMDQSEGHLQVAAHNFRRAISSADEELRLQRLHNALEVIAKKETADRVQEQCPKCGHSWEKHPATNRFIKEMLERRPVSSDVANRFTKIRGKIAHGAQVRELSYLSEALEVAGGVEAAVASEIAKRASLTIARRNGVATGVSLAIHHAVGAPDGSFLLIQTRAFLPMRFTTIDDNLSRKTGSARVGAPFSPDKQPEIAPCIWPKLERS